MYYVITERHTHTFTQPLLSILEQIFLPDTFLSKSHLPPESHFHHSTKVTVAPLVLSALAFRFQEAAAQVNSLTVTDRLFPDCPFQLFSLRFIASDPVTLHRRLQPSLRRPNHRPPRSSSSWRRAGRWRKWWRPLISMLMQNFTRKQRHRLPLVWPSRRHQLLGKQVLWMCSIYLKCCLKYLKRIKLGNNVEGWFTTKQKKVSCP